VHVPKSPLQHVKGSLCSKHRQTSPNMALPSEWLVSKECFLCFQIVMFQPTSCRWLCSTIASIIFVCLTAKPKHLNGLLRKKNYYPLILRNDLDDKSVRNSKLKLKKFSSLNPPRWFNMLLCYISAKQ
jgi:hypothetical protein